MKVGEDRLCAVNNKSHFRSDAIADGLFIIAGAMNGFPNDRHAPGKSKIEALIAGLQKVGAELELHKAPAQTVLNNR